MHIQQVYVSLCHIYSIIKQLYNVNMNINQVFYACHHSTLFIHVILCNIFTNIICTAVCILRVLFLLQCLLLLIGIAYQIAAFKCVQKLV